MRAIANWESVQASNGGGQLLPPGCYTCKIVKVSDHTNEQKPYLNVVFDVWDDASRSFVYQSIALDAEQDWRHSFRFYVGTDFGLARYKALVEACEGSEENGGWRYVNADGAEQTLAGRWVGLAIGHRLYTNSKGKDSTQLDLAGSHTVAEVRSGAVEAPGVRDDRDARPQAPAPAWQAPQAPSAAFAADEDIPF